MFGHRHRLLALALCACGLLTFWSAPRSIAGAAPAAARVASDDEEAARDKFEELKAKFQAEKDKQPYERAATIRAFGTAPCRESVQFLRGLFETEDQPFTWAMAARALGDIGNLAAAQSLINVGLPKLLPTEYLRDEILGALRGPWDDEAEEWILKGALRPEVRNDPLAHELVIKMIAGLRTPDRFKALEREIQPTASARIIVEVLEALRERADEKVGRVAAKLLRSPDVDVRVAVYDFLEATGSERFRKVFENGLKDPHWEVRAICTDAIGRIRPRNAVKLTASSLKDNDKHVQIAAVQALLRIGGRDVIEPLFMALDSVPGRVKDDISDALARLTGRNFGPASAQWESWWATTKGRQLPETPLTPEELSELKAAEEEQKTLLMLYHGLRVLSDPVFVIDCSESMQEQYISLEEREQAEGKGTEAPKRGRTEVAEPEKETDRPGSEDAKADFQSRLTVAKKALIDVINGFQPDRRFNVIRFDSQIVDFMRTELQSQEKTLIACTEEVKEKVRSFIEKAKPAGQTNFSGALRAAFEYDDADTVFLLSDGAPTFGVTDPEELLKTIARWNRRRRVRINTIGIDLKPEEKALMQDIAGQNFGVFVER